MNLDFTGITLPFTASDVLSSGAGLFSVVGLFVLLGMAFVLAPKIIDLIRTTLK